MRRLVAASMLALLVACGGSDDDASTDDAAGAGGDGAGAGGSGAGGDGTGATGGAPSGGGCDATPGTHTGDGTFYAADGSGNCSFPASKNLDVAAMNDPEYAGSAVCGACAAVTGPKGSLTVRIVDRCPECKKGDLDLSAEAFAKIAEPKDGRVSISWKLVACDVSGPIVYHFKEGSNEWWTAVQIRNHRFAIAKLEYKDAKGAYVEVKRESYNYFVEPKGMGKGPYAFRVTDVMGHVLTDEGIAFVENGDSAGAAQLPACPLTTAHRPAAARRPLFRGARPC
jgi:expansin (peptidoglycan-binding protein)